MEVMEVVEVGHLTVGLQTQDTGMKTSAQAFLTPHTPSSQR